MQQRKPELLPTGNATALFTDFAQDPAIGMWKDREEMRDSSAGKNELRREHWPEARL